MITDALSDDSTLIPTLGACKYAALILDTSSALVLELVCQTVYLRDRCPASTPGSRLSASELVADAGWLVSVTVSAGCVRMHVTNSLCNQTMCSPLPLCMCRGQPVSTNRRNLLSSSIQRREEGTAVNRPWLAFILRATPIMVSSLPAPDPCLSMRSCKQPGRLIPSIRYGQ